MTRCCPTVGALALSLLATHAVVSVSVAVGRVESTRDYRRSSNFDLELEHTLEVSDRRQLI